MHDMKYIEDVTQSPRVKQLLVVFVAAASLEFLDLLGNSGFAFLASELLRPVFE